MSYIGKIDRLKLFAVLSIVIILCIGIASVYTTNVLASNNTKADKSTTKHSKIGKVKVFNATIVNITDTYIYVESEAYTGKLIAKGKWIYIANAFGRGNWAEVKDLVNKGEALIIMASIHRKNKTYHILLGLKEDSVILIRPILMRHMTQKHLHTKTYMGVYATILDNKDNYMIVNRSGHKILVLINPESRWYKAGYGVVTWSEVRSEFKSGDMIRIFCHNILIIKEGYAKYLGFKALIWGYSGAIIDLTSGTAITRYK